MLFSRGTFHDRILQQSATLGLLEEKVQVGEEEEEEGEEEETRLTGREGGRDDAQECAMQRCALHRRKQGTKMRKRVQCTGMHKKAQCTSGPVVQCTRGERGCKNTQVNAQEGEIHKDTQCTRGCNAQKGTVHKVCNAQEVKRVHNQRTGG